MKIMELLICTMLFCVSSFYVIKSTRYNIMVNKSNNIKNEIGQIINFTRKKALYDEKIYIIYFYLDEKKIKYLDNIFSLDNNFNYISLNNENNFIRIINEKGNINKGFTIKIQDKNGKIFQSIIYNNNSGINIPLQKDN